MGFAGSKVFLGIVFFLMATTLILHTIGYVVHYWWYSDIEIMGVTGSAVGGLWFVCIYRDDQTFGICATYEQTSDLEGRLSSYAIGVRCSSNYDTTPMYYNAVFHGSTNSILRRICVFFFFFLFIIQT